MPKTVIWSELAEEDFDNILSYLARKWSSSVVHDFISITENSIDQISLNPKQFPLIYKTSGIRRCVLTRHNTLYYRATKDLIEILRIFDTRQDPQKLRFKQY